MIDVTLPEDLVHWLISNRDEAYFLGFVAISLGFYALYPFTIGLNHATSTDTSFKNIDIGRHIRKPHRLALVACAIVAFAALHFGLSMPGLALIGGGAMLGFLMVLDHRQIYRDYPRRP